MNLRRAIALFFSAFVLLTAMSARADLDPARANADAAEILSTQRGFCEHPSVPLSESALRMCAYVDDIPDCQPMADACDAALHTKTTSFPKLAAFFRWLARAFGALFNGFGAAGVWVMLGITLILILYPIVQALAASRRMPTMTDDVALANLKMRTDAEAATLSREDDPERMLAEADRLSARKEYDLALYRYLHAALLALDKRGSVRIAKGTTHGEYVRSCTDAAARPPLRDLVREIDSVRFGGRAPSEGGVSVAQERATWIVRHASVALGALVLFAFFLVGCGMQSPGANDPAGPELLTALLRKQGMKVEHVSSSLAHLKLPTPTTIETTPALYVDVNRVPLSEEAQGHLVTWVEAGGTLILAGSPEGWPAELKVKREATASTTIDVKTYPALAPNEENEEEETSEPAPRVDHGKLAHPAAITWIDPRTFVVATTSDEKNYAVGQNRGSGSIYGTASDDLFTNAGLAVPGNAAAAIAILSNVPRHDFMIAAPIDGFSPPSNPFSGLLNAGLGLPLGHAAFAIAILFLAVGVRFARPRPDPPPTRRVFAEHVAATAAVYQRSRASKHALASFSRFAENRLAKRLGRGAPDVITLLSQRSGERIEECAHVWGRALAAREFEYEKPNGDELEILRRLTVLYAKTMRSI